MLFAEIVALVSLTAVLSRFVRQASHTEGLRRWVTRRSRLLDQLLACPHCISFWIAAAFTAVLWPLQSLAGFCSVGAAPNTLTNRWISGAIRRPLVPPSPAPYATPYEEDVSIEAG